MIENKYRIFDKEDYDYCEEPDFRWTLSRNGKLYNSENDKWHNIGDRYIVEFSIGLKDKQGKEVYDGDIGFMQNFRANILIEFYRGSFGYFTSKGELHEQFHAIATHTHISIIDDVMTKFEIIGNIHHNPSERHND